MERSYQHNLIRPVLKDICFFFLGVSIVAPIWALARYGISPVQLAHGLHNATGVILKYFSIFLAYSLLEAFIKKVYFKAYITEHGIRGRNTFGKMVYGEWSEVINIKKYKFGEVVRIEIKNHKFPIKVPASVLNSEYISKTNIRA